MVDIDRMVEGQTVLLDDARFPAGFGRGSAEVGRWGMVFSRETCSYHISLCIFFKSRRSNKRCRAGERVL